MSPLAPSMLIATALVFTSGCATDKEVRKRVEFTIEIRHLDGRLQWRTSQKYESGTDDPPGVNERIGK